MLVKDRLVERNIVLNRFTGKITEVSGVILEIIGNGGYDWFRLNFKYVALTEKILIEVLDAKRKGNKTNVNPTYFIQGKRIFFDNIVGTYRDFDTGFKFGYLHEFQSHFLFTMDKDLEVNLEKLKECISV